MSVITPVYNGARYIAECIASVRAQTFDDWRYTVLDNCSTDDTLSAAREAAADDPRIDVVSASEYLPIVANWNRAVAHAHPGARYLKVLHADDTLLPECLAQMVALAQAHPAVGVVSAYRLAGSRVDLDGLALHEGVLPGREIGRRTLAGGPYVFGAPSSLLIRADLVRSRGDLYHEENLHADTEAVYDLLRECDFGFVHQVLTFTRRHDQAVTSSFVHRFGTWPAGYVQTLALYGRDFLDDATYHRRMHDFLGRYSRYMTKQTLRRRPWRDTAFRRHHQDVAASILDRLPARDRRERIIVGWWSAVLALAARSARNAAPDSGRADGPVATGIRSRADEERDE